MQLHCTLTTKKHYSLECCSVIALIFLNISAITLL